MSEGITFPATFNKGTTTIDGGWRVTFDLPNDQGHIVAQLAALQGDQLQIAVVLFDPSQAQDG